ncbi:ComF family protein [Crenobacter cavernae]|uniref:ComF family protein n=1 Tax=Crenobacter cavernae TaxID=2290923 RepID=UPI001F0C2739|nr:ComF family protein [Crenobacter cavernae]
MPVPLSNYLPRILNKRPFFQQPCRLCGRHEGWDGLCDGCRAMLPTLHGPLCPVCAEPQPHALPPGVVCGRCQRRLPAFDALFAPYRYDYPLAELLHHYKYGKALGDGALLASLLAGFAHHKQGSADLVVPVPLAKERLAERGFNQCDALALALADIMKSVFSPKLCWRKRNTPAQARLDLTARRRNLDDAFGVESRLDGLCVAIVDDVASSGSTLSALAFSLKKQGAKRVEAWALARAVSPKT